PAGAPCRRQSGNRPGAISRRATGSSSTGADATRHPPPETTAMTSRQVHDITFWYGPLAPDAWLAFERLPQALMGLSVHVRYRPLFLGGLLRARGQLGPAEIPDKREWTFRHAQWLARQQGTVLALPAAHPFNPLPLLRLGLAAASSPLPGDTSRYVTGLLFRHVWEGG